MKRQLARDKSELEAHIAQVMGLLFPQVGLSVCARAPPRVCAKDASVLAEGPRKGWG